TAGATLDFQVIGEFEASGQVFLIDDVSVRTLGTDVPPVVQVSSDVSGSWRRQVAFLVSAHDPEGEPINGLEADLSGLPGATFTVSPDRTLGTLRWFPRIEDVRDEPYIVTFSARNAAVTTASTRIHVDPNLARNP